MNVRARIGTTAQNLMLLDLMLLAMATSSLSAVAQTASPDNVAKQSKLTPNNLVVSRTVYDNKASNVTVGEILPPNCALTTGGCAGSTGAPFDGTYPYIFNNATYDGSFGITSKIYLDELTVTGAPVKTIEVPNSEEKGLHTTNRLVSSFSSKLELGLHLSTDGQYLTFMGYVAPVNELDVSNSNTPLVIDPTNGDGQTPYYRAVAKLGLDGKFEFTETNAFSGNNGRSAILNNSYGNKVYYAAGNAGHGAKPQPDGVLLGAGAQLIAVVPQKEDTQDPGLPTPGGSFNVTEIPGAKADKLGKDNNFRGVTVFNDVVYYSKGSGGNGVNTVYFVDTTGTACPAGVGLPVAGAKLPTQPLSYNLATLQTTGLPSNMCVLAGFPATPAKQTTPVNFPFGMWFANATTLYVADEGDGYAGGADLYTHAAAQTNAGLEKWVLNTRTKTWNLAYTMQSGLNLGVPYVVGNYPTGTNATTMLPWAPATDGLRNITGIVGPDGPVAVYATTSTTSGAGDTGADPNKLVVAIDLLNNTDPRIGAQLPIFDLKDAKFGEVLRGVSFTPGSDVGYFQNQ